jgi:sirohydrochlorin cobaltochelatase
MKMKKMLAILFAMVLALSMLTACGGSTTTETEEAEATTEAAAEEETEEAGEEKEDALATGDFTKDDPRNQDEIGEKEILVVSFGTSFNDSRVATIKAIEDAVVAAYPDWAVRRAFTADIVIDHIATYPDLLTDEQKQELGKTDEELKELTTIDSVEQALKRARDNGVKQLVVAPTHLMSGNEYDELQATLAKYTQDFETPIQVSDPLLTSDEDKEAVAKALVEVTKEYDDGETAIVFMGHGTDHEANAVYTEMQDIIRKAGSDNYFVGVVHDGAKPDVNDVLAEVQKNDAYKKVVLRDMMVVAGDHAHNDMADPDDPESWYSIFTAADYDVTALPDDGLGQVKEIQDIYVSHVGAAVDKSGK